MKNKVITKKRLQSYFLAISLLAITFSLFYSSPAQAASYYLSSSSTKVNVNDLFTIKLSIDTQGKTINNAEGTIQFPKDLVEAISVSSSSSIFSLWVAQPSFSNINGTIVFNGGIPNPGYTGKGGIVLSATFKAKSAGTASFVFGDAAIRENDGLGTDILTGQSPITITVVGATNTPEKPPVVQTPAPTTQTPDVDISNGSAPVIYSSTYPDQTAWYSAKAGTLSWRLPSNANAVQTLLGNRPDSTPTVLYTPAIYQKNISNLTDGTWYFHLRYRTASTWSKVAHYKIQIDSEPPSDLTVTSSKVNACVSSLSLAANDTLSGVDYFDVKVDDLALQKVTVEEAHEPVVLPELGPGNHDLMVTAFDKAGNRKESNLTLAIDEPPAPMINTVPSGVRTGDSLKISGSSPSVNAPIKIVAQAEAGEQTTYDATTDENGSFSTMIDLKAGNYLIWAYQVGCNGGAGALSPKINVQIEPLAVRVNPFAAFQWPAVDYQFIFYFIILLTISLFGWYKYLSLNKKFKAIERRADMAFILLLEKAQKQLAVFEKASKKKRLNIEEEKALKNLKDVIDKIESLK